LTQKKVVSFFQGKIGVTPSVAARVTPTLVMPLSATIKTQLRKLSLINNANTANDLVNEPEKLIGVRQK